MNLVECVEYMAYLVKEEDCDRDLAIERLTEIIGDDARANLLMAEISACVNDAGDVVDADGKVCRIVMPKYEPEDEDLDFFGAPCAECGAHEDEPCAGPHKREPLTCVSDEEP